MSGGRRKLSSSGEFRRFRRFSSGEIRNRFSFGETFSGTLRNSPELPLGHALPPQPRNQHARYRRARRPRHLGRHRKCIILRRDANSPGLASRLVPLGREHGRGLGLPRGSLALGRPRNRGPGRARSLGPHLPRAGTAGIPLPPAPGTSMGTPPAVPIQAREGEVPPSAAPLGAAPGASSGNREYRAPAIRFSPTGYR